MIEKLFVGVAVIGVATALNKKITAGEFSGGEGHPVIGLEQREVDPHLIQLAEECYRLSSGDPKYWEKLYLMAARGDSESLLEELEAVRMGSQSPRVRATFLDYSVRSPGKPEPQVDDLSQPGVSLGATLKPLPLEIPSPPKREPEPLSLEIPIAPPPSRKVDVAPPAPVPPPIQQGGVPNYTKAIDYFFLLRNKDVMVSGEPIVGPQIVRYPIKIGSNADVQSVNRLLDTLGVELRLAKSPLLSRDRGAAINIPRDNPRVIPWFSENGFPSYPSSGGIHFPLGVDLYGKTIWADLDSCPHWLIGGTTGSGKSSLGRVILVAQHQRWTAEDLELHLCDPKIVELNKIQEDSHLCKRFATEKDDIREVILDARRNMRLRYERMSREGVVHVKDMKEKLPRVIVWVDEAAGVTDDPACVEGLAVLAQQGRAAGFHVVVAAQRPSALTIPPQIRSQLTGRICLLTSRTEDSHVTLGGKDGRGYSLVGKGDMIVIAPGIDTRLQGYLLSADEAAEAIKAANPELKEKIDAKHSDEPVQPDSDLLQDSDLCPDRTPLLVR